MAYEQVVLVKARPSQVTSRSKTLAELNFVNSASEGLMMLPLVRLDAGQQNVLGPVSNRVTSSPPIHLLRSKLSNFPASSTSLEVSILVHSACLVKRYVHLEYPTATCAFKDLIWVVPWGLTEVGMKEEVV